MVHPFTHVPNPVGELLGAAEVDGRFHHAEGAVVDVAGVWPDHVDILVLVVGHHGFERAEADDITLEHVAKPFVRRGIDGELPTEDRPADAVGQ